MKTFLLRWLLPPAYAALPFVGFGLLRAGSLDDIVSFAAVVLLFAYTFAGLPALAFAWIMGRLQRRGFRHGGVRLLAAMSLGFGAGVAIGMVFANAFVLFIPLGLFVGLLVELTIISTERRRPFPQP